MTAERFATLLHELSAVLDVPLHVDRNHACLFRVHEQLSVQIQLDATQERLWMASFICELPPGKFRENILAEALKANNLPDPRTGIFGYLAINNHLTLHQRYPLASLDGQKLSQLLAGFIDYADLWRDAIARGQPGPAPIQSSKTTNPFGLKP